MNLVQRKRVIQQKLKITRSFRKNSISNIWLYICGNTRRGNASVNYNESWVSFHASRARFVKTARKMKTSLTPRGCGHFSVFLEKENERNIVIKAVFTPYGRTKLIRRSLTYGGENFENFYAYVSTKIFCFSFC